MTGYPGTCQTHPEIEDHHANSSSVHFSWTAWEPPQSEASNHCITYSMGAPFSLIQRESPPRLHEESCFLGRVMDSDDTRVMNAIELGSNHVATGLQQRWARPISNKCRTQTSFEGPLCDTNSLGLVDSVVLPDRVEAWP
jgi:hypothetical protein